MPSIRAPVLRTALQPAGRNLPRTQPFLTQMRYETRDEKWYEPNDGGKSQAQPKDHGTTGHYNLDGTSSMSSGRGLIVIGAATAVLAGSYFMFVGKPDAVGKNALKNDRDAIKHHTGSDRQRVGGPERSEK